MMEYNKHIEKFSLKSSWWFSELLSESEWGDISKAKSYLEKYWLTEAEYNSKWISIQKEIFNGLSVSPPELVFKEFYEIIVLEGGCLFSKDDFELLQSCLLKMGEKFFIVIENNIGNEPEEPLFRMKYPSNISWEELMSGNFISSTIVEHPNKEFFVFGETTKWGKYSANDYTWPLDLLGFKSSVSEIFKNVFELSKEETNRISEWLPSNYRSLSQNQIQDG